MRILMYMAITANGYIAKQNHETPWSDEEWQSFTKMVQRIGNIVIGRKTFDIMSQGGELLSIGSPFTVIVSNKTSADSHFVSSPEEAIKLLDSKGFSEVLVAGGAMLNAAFMQKNLVDELYLDVEPFIFGQGIKLFSDSNFERRLTLLEATQLSPDTIQLHYEVIKRHT